VDFARLLSGINNPEILAAWIDDLLSLGVVTSKSGILWFATLTILEGLVGSLLIIAVILLLMKREGTGLALAAAGLLLSLVGVNLLVFYFKQFSTVITALIQFLILLLVYHYRSRAQVENR
jgi:CHASE2 domain-containing sensor protein